MLIGIIHFGMDRCVHFRRSEPHGLSRPLLSAQKIRLGGSMVHTFSRDPHIREAVMRRLILPAVGFCLYVLSFFLPAIKGWGQGQGPNRMLGGFALGGCTRALRFVQSRIASLARLRAGESSDAGVSSAADLATMGACPLGDSRVGDRRRDRLLAFLRSDPSSTPCRALRLGGWNREYAEHRTMETGHSPQEQPVEERGVRVLPSPASRRKSDSHVSAIDFSYVGCPNEKTKRLRRISISAFRSVCGTGNSEARLRLRRASFSAGSFVACRKFPAQKR
jgi:hypothetical protein